MRAQRSSGNVFSSQTYTTNPDKNTWLWHVTKSKILKSLCVPGVALQMVFCIHAMFLEYASCGERSKTAVTPWLIQQGKHGRRSCRGTFQSPQVDSKASGSSATVHLRHFYLIIFVCSVFYKSMNCAAIFSFFSRQCTHSTGHVLFWDVYI